MAQLYTMFGVVALLLVLSVFASKAAVKLGVPTLLLFMALGIVAGSEGVGGLWVRLPALLRALVWSPLVYILLCSRIRTHAAELRQQMWPALSLATIGRLRKLSRDGRVQPLSLWPEVGLRSASWCSGFVYGCSSGFQRLTSEEHKSKTGLAAPDRSGVGQQ